MSCKISLFGREGYLTPPGLIDTESIPPYMVIRAEDDSKDKTAKESVCHVTFILRERGAEKPFFFTDATLHADSNRDLKVEVSQTYIGVMSPKDVKCTGVPGGDHANLWKFNFTDAVQNTLKWESAGSRMAFIFKFTWKGSLELTIKYLELGYSEAEVSVP